MKKNHGGPFGSYLLNNIANQAHFHTNSAGLALLLSRQLLNGTHDFFVLCNIFIFIYFVKYKTIEIHANTFSILNISAVGSVYGMLRWAKPDELEHFEHFYKPFTTFTTSLLLC